MYTAYSMNSVDTSKIKGEIKGEEENTYATWNKEKNTWGVNYNAKKYPPCPSSPPPSLPPPVPPPVPPARPIPPPIKRDSKPPYLCVVLDDEAF